MLAPNDDCSCAFPTLFNHAQPILVYSLENTKVWLLSLGGPSEYYRPPSRYRPQGVFFLYQEAVLGRVPSPFWDMEVQAFQPGAVLKL